VKASGEAESKVIDHEASGGHERWQDVIIATLDGRAPERERVELNAHLSDCPECRAIYDDYRELFLRLKEAPEESLPASFWDRMAAEIDRRIAEGRAPAERSEASWSWVAGGLVAAGIAILTLVGVYLGLPRGGAEPKAFVTTPRELIASGEVTNSESVSVGSVMMEPPVVVTDPRDPLAMLAEAEDVLRGLTPAEAEELLRTLESQT
jgi:anti-sigma factor RsiW